MQGKFRESSLRRGGFSLLGMPMGRGPVTPVIKWGWRNMPKHYLCLLCSPKTEGNHKHPPSCPPHCHSYGLSEVHPEKWPPHTYKVKPSKGPSIESLSNSSLWNQSQRSPSQLPSHHPPQMSNPPQPSFSSPSVSLSCRLWPFPPRGGNHSESVQTPEPNIVERDRWASRFLSIFKRKYLKTSTISKAEEKPQSRFYGTRKRSFSLWRAFLNPTFQVISSS